MARLWVRASANFRNFGMEASSPSRNSASGLMIIFPQRRRALFELIEQLNKPSGYWLFQSTRIEFSQPRGNEVVKGLLRESIRTAAKRGFSTPSLLRSHSGSNRLIVRAVRSALRGKAGQNLRFPSQRDFSGRVLPATSERAFTPVPHQPYPPSLPLALPSASRVRWLSRERFDVRLPN